MAVHVDEIHTDVVPAAEPAGQPTQQPHKAKHLGAAEEAWLDARRSVTVHARRTAAEAFDD